MIPVARHSERNIPAMLPADRESQVARRDRPQLVATGRTPTADSRVQAWLDLQALRAEADRQELAVLTELLRGQSITAVATALGIPRTTLHSRLGALRNERRKAPNSSTPLIPLQRSQLKPR
jgi:DNA-directed RNA polymerase specialized sigma24 family protein